MAVDKKSQHVGNHGGRYTDIDGMTKQFTYIDHDKKTIPMGVVKVDETFDFKAYRSDLVRRITDVPASLCPTLFTDYTVRGANVSTVEWNTDMLVDSGVPLEQLRDLCVILENRAEAMRLTV